MEKQVMDSWETLPLDWLTGMSRLLLEWKRGMMFKEQVQNAEGWNEIMRLGTSLDKAFASHVDGVMHGVND